MLLVIICDKWQIYTLYLLAYQVTVRVGYLDLLLSYTLFLCLTDVKWRQFLWFVDSDWTRQMYLDYVIVLSASLNIKNYRFPFPLSPSRRGCTNNTVYVDQTAVGKLCIFRDFSRVCQRRLESNCFPSSPPPRPVKRSPLLTRTKITLRIDFCRGGGGGMYMTML